MTWQMAAMWVGLMACGGSEEVPAEPEAPAAEAPAPVEEAPKAPKKAKAGKAQKGEPVTEENWKEHPEIRKIRKMVNQINKLEAKEGWDEMSYPFTNDCGDIGIQKVSMVSVSLPDGTEARRFFTEAGQGDISRETTSFYGADGKPIFAMSTYAHASAESKQLSRVYYKDGAVLFQPSDEQKGPNAGPEDDVPLTDRVQATVDEAQAHFFKVRNECQDLEE